MKKNFLQFAEWLTIVAAAVVCVIVVLCYSAAEDECDQLRENARAARVYVQYLEDALDELDPVYIGDVACETDAFCSYYESLPRDLVKVSNN